MLLAPGATNTHHQRLRHDRCIMFHRESATPGAFPLLRPSAHCTIRTAKSHLTYIALVPRHQYYPSESAHSFVYRSLSIASVASLGTNDRLAPSLYPCPCFFTFCFPVRPPSVLPSASSLVSSSTVIPLSLTGNISGLGNASKLLIFLI